MSSCSPHTSISHRSPHFYLDDRFVVFLVEDELYKINSHFLVRESVAFRDMFSLPKGKNPESTPEGTDDEHPIRLEGVTKQEFDSLLGLLYHRMHDDYNPVLESWLSILSIADRYAFDKFRARAVRKVEARQSSVDPVQRVILAKKFDFPGWLPFAYEEFVTADVSLTHEEADRLGFA